MSMNSVKEIPRFMYRLNLNAPNLISDYVIGVTNARPIGFNGGLSHV